MKVIINTDFGGFGISAKAFELYKQRAGIAELPKNYWHTDYREDPVMISIVEELGEEANDSLSCLVVVDVPEEYEYVIDDYDGLEKVVLLIKESYLRDLIRAGDEDAIVEYVDRTKYVKCDIEDDDWEE